MKWSMQCFFNNKLKKNRHENVFFQFILLLLSMPLYAEINYLFPSDIIDQSELDAYNIDRESHYMTQRNWFYPDDIRKDEQSTAQNYLPVQAHPNDYPSRRVESEGYKYSNYPSRQSLKFRSLNTDTSYVPSALRGKVSWQYSGPIGKNANYSGNRMYEQSNRVETITTAERFSQQEKTMYPNLLYATDVEPDRHAINQKNNAGFYKSSHQGMYLRRRINNHVVSVPSYNIPRIQSSPLYNSLSAFGIFSQQ
ncbi:MAG: hypothetical protein QNL62_17575 [Gammaproteobacteria bacterium]|nr:hypothetical protein [Gammaproteobacteria bacterium]